MKRVNFLFELILILAIVFVGCNKAVQMNDEDGEEFASIIGKWKLVNVTIPFIGEENDYSQYNIVYEFNANGILLVSGKIDHIDAYRGHGTGEHFYSIIDENEASETIPEFRLKIGTAYWAYRISSKELLIDASPLDGTILNFIKIE